MVDVAMGPMRELPEVRITGSFNARDVGGHETVDGRTMATGVLYRSASLDSIDAAGRADLAELAVRLVIDLRSSNQGAPGVVIDALGTFVEGEVGEYHSRVGNEPIVIEANDLARDYSDLRAIRYLLVRKHNDPALLRCYKLDKGQVSDAFVTPYGVFVAQGAD